MSAPIPDFEKDAATIAEYEAALQREERALLSEAEGEVRSTYGRRRTAVLSELTASSNVLDERRKQAEAALHAYAERYPDHVHGSQVQRPTFFQVLFSFGGASRLYNHAAKTSEDVLIAQAAYRRHQRAEDELETWLSRSLARAAADIREKMQSQDWLNRFHSQPDVEELWKHVQAIREEREDYEQRLAAGDVTPLEQRGRFMAENKIAPLRDESEKVVIDSILHFGDLLSFWIFVDAAGKKSFLPYDRRLEHLMDWAFDTYTLVNRLEVKFSRSEDGRRLSALDQFIQRFGSESEGRNQWRNRTSEIRVQMDAAGHTLADDPEDKRLLDLLAALVASTSI